jgi:hypothetical protein
MFGLFASRLMGYTPGIKGGARSQFFGVEAGPVFRGTGRQFYFGNGSFRKIKIFMVW